MRKRGSGGFTVLEITIAVAVASSLMLAGTAAGKSALRETRLRKAQAEVAAIDSALHRYILKRGRLPVDLDGDGVAVESEIISQLTQWNFLPRPLPDASGLVIDPWDTPYVVVFARDYVKRAADVLCDASGRPYNDYRNGFQVYSRILEDDTYTAGFDYLSNVPTTVAYPGVPEADDVVVEPVDPVLVDPVIEEPEIPSEPTVPPADGHGHRGSCGRRLGCSSCLVTIALMRQAETSVHNADVYIDAALDHAGRRSVTAAFYASKSIRYVGAAAALVARAAEYDSTYDADAAAYAQKVTEYCGRARACGALR